MWFLRLSARLSRRCCWLLLFASSMFFSCHVSRAWLRLPTPAATGALLLAPCRAAMTTSAHAPLLVSFVSCVSLSHIGASTRWPPPRSDGWYGVGHLGRLLCVAFVPLGVVD